eukprot:355949-Chlamydomonas_euryale.AAC.1
MWCRCEAVISGCALCRPHLRQHGVCGCGCAYLSKCFRQRTCQLTSGEGVMRGRVIQFTSDWACTLHPVGLRLQSTAAGTSTGSRLSARFVMRSSWCRTAMQWCVQPATSAVITFGTKVCRDHIWHQGLACKCRHQSSTCQKTGPARQSSGPAR